MFYQTECCLDRDMSLQFLSPPKTEKQLLRAEEQYLYQGFLGLVEKADVYGTTRYAIRVSSVGDSNNLSELKSAIRLLKHSLTLWRG